MLAAILATMAIDSERLDCIKCEGPLELRLHWNPHECKRLFWVDDAFGPNQLREDYVDAWIEFMPKIKAAMEDGNHFILTSRTHIWNEAAYKLGTRNHPLLESKKALVYVGSLTPEERQQILYNHVKAGEQDGQWKQSIKPHLQTLSEEQTLLPEIARRLGNPMYTTGIHQIPEDLVRFVRSPDEFLRRTFLELTEAHQAAMTLVFLARSKLPVRNVAGEDCKLVADKYGTTVASIAQSLERLDGSYLIKREDSGHLCWSFVHPTFSDAISSILSSRPDLVDLYLVGAKIETVLAEAICEGVPAVKDAVVVPARSFETLVTRLLEIPDERELNELLFQFLNRRATEEIVRRVLALDPDLVAREGSPRPWLDIVRFAEVRFRAKASSYGLLDEGNRKATCDALVDASTYHLDLSFLSDDEILALFKARELIQLTFRLIGMLQDEIPSKISSLADDADADSDIDDQFSKVDEFVRKLQYVGEDSHVIDLLQDLEHSISEAKDVVRARKSDEDSDDSFFANVPSGTSTQAAESRSIFSDVDS